MGEGFPTPILLGDKEFAGGDALDGCEALAALQALATAANPILTITGVRDFRVFVFSRLEVASGFA